MTTKKILLFFFLSFTILFLLSQKYLLKKPKESKQQITNLSITPDYQRSLKKLALTIPQKLVSAEETLLLLEQNYRNLLLNLPTYTELIIFTHQENKEILKTFLIKLGIDNQVTYHFSENSALEPWAQDYFEPVKSNEFSALLLPLSSKKAPAFKRIAERNAAVSLLENSLIANFFFEGGNIMAANNSFGNFIFIDFETIKKTQDLYKMFKKTLTHAEILQLIQATFPTSKVVVLGNVTREHNFVHLDQSILFLENNNVIVYEISDASESKAFLQHQLYQETLSSLGFNVIKFPVSSVEIKKSTSSLNAIAFKDFETQEKRIIFPVYPDDLKASSSEKSFLKKTDLTGNALSIFELFIELGYSPIPIFDNNLFQRGGSFHCISNVIE